MGRLEGFEFNSYFGAFNDFSSISARMFYFFMLRLDGAVCYKIFLVVMPFSFKSLISA